MKILLTRISAFLFCFMICACNNEKITVYHTWNSLKKMNYAENVQPLSEEIIPYDFFPWAGIVSHHILAHEYIDAWFHRLSMMRKPKTFFIISPDHNKLSLMPYSLTTGSWDSGFGLVESDTKKVKEFSRLLDVDTDERVFEYEHGICDLMPYIKKHFPQSKVVAIIISGDSEVNTKTCNLLADILEKEFKNKRKQDNFLIISSDFSHKGDLKETFINDSKSEQYLRNVAQVPWNIVNCDNRAGIYIFNRIRKIETESVILYNKNSWEISGQGEDDITSYFFVYFGEK